MSPAWKPTEHTWHVRQAQPKAAQGCCLEVSVALRLGIRVSGVPIQGHPSDSVFGSFLKMGYNDLEWWSSPGSTPQWAVSSETSWLWLGSARFEHGLSPPNPHVRSLVEDFSVGRRSPAGSRDGVQQEVLRSLNIERTPLEGAKVCLLGLLITRPPLISPSHTWSHHFDNTHHNSFTEN